MRNRRLLSIAPLLALAAAPFGCAGAPDAPDQGRDGPVGQAAQAANGSCGRRGCVSSTVNLTIERTASAPYSVVDTELDQTNPDTNEGSSTSMTTGPDASGNQHYALVQFDLSALPTPASLAPLNASGIKIESAYVTLTEGPTAPTGAATVNVHNVTSPWDEGVVTWDQGAPSWDPTVVASFSNVYPATVPDTLPNFSIVSLVQGWATTPSSNNGILLESPAGSGQTTFYTSEAGDVWIQPELTLIYALSCLPDYADCNNVESDGCEANLQTDPNNCSACGDVCPAGDVCQAGVCVAGCAAGLTMCGGACVDESTDPNNCGACGDVCAGGVCEGGACLLEPDCEAILGANPGAPSGPYTIEPSGTPIATYCDMTTGGGGWTLVANGWIPSYAPAATDPVDTSVGQFVSSAGIGVPWTQMLLQCESSTTDVDRIETIGFTSTNLDDITYSSASETILPGDNVAYHPAWCTGDSADYADEYWFAGINQRYIVRVGQIHCALDYNSVGGQNDNPALGDWGRVWVRGPACAGGEVQCGAVCVDESTDANNCGACGNACAAGDACCGAGCVDESIDVSNCGACGNVCAAGDSCEGGVCTPPPVILLASGQNGPWPITIDATTVYWGNVGDHTIHSVPKGGGASTLLGTAQAGPYDMAAGPSSLYWSEDALIETVAKTGGPVTTFASAQPAPRGVASDGVHVWWANYFGNDVLECGVGGCGGAPASFGTGQNPFQVAVDSANVYWLDQGDGYVYVCPKTGCTGAPSHIASGGNAGIASDGVNVYYAGQTSVFKVPVGGGTTVTLLSGLGAPSGIATDGVDVYYTDIHTGTVGKCSVNGCGNTPTVLGNGYDEPQTIVVDGTSVYFADTAYGNVWQLAK